MSSVFPNGKHSRPVGTTSGPAKVGVWVGESGCLHMSSVIATRRVAALQIGVTLFRLVLSRVVLGAHIVGWESHLSSCRRVGDVRLITVVIVLVVLVSLGARKGVVVVGFAVCTVTSIVSRGSEIVVWDTVNIVGIGLELLDELLALAVG